MSCDFEKAFSLVCVAPDGAKVIEGYFDTLEECGRRSADMGSRRFFYPFYFAVEAETGKAFQLFEDAGPEPFESLDAARGWCREYGGSRL